MRALLMSSLIFFTCACVHNSLPKDSLANQNQQQCEMTNKEKDSLLKLDFHSFDQSLPDGGWRKYSSCLQLSRDLLEEYISANAHTLLNWQKRILIWHSGQVSAIMGEYKEAIAHFEQTFNDAEKTNDPFLWNPYVEATIAFLKKDLQTLLNAKKKLENGSQHNQVNLIKVNSFVNCFHLSYKEAYLQNCFGE